VSDGVMSAAVLRGLGEPLRIESRPRPVPGPGQVLIRVRAVGLCHTDLHLAAGSAIAPPLPIVLGHEIAGEVAEVGAGVVTRPGDRVLAYYYDGCHDCDWCASGAENLCASPAAKVGFDSDGGLSEYYLTTERCLVPIEPQVAFADAAVLGCSGTTAVRVVRSVAEVRAGEVVAVIGAGGVGLAVIQVAVAGGATVVAVDPHEGSRKQAVHCGAAAAIDPAGEDPVRAVLEASGGRGCDVVIDTVGNEHTPNQAVLMTRVRGRVVLVGYTERPSPMNVLEMVVRESVVRGSVGATLSDAHQVMAMAAEGRIRAFIEAEYPLDRVNEALDRLRGGDVVGRLIIAP
jgi:propanol-preferring alcohol dehydrogenase